MQTEITKIYEGSNLSGSVSGVIYLPIMRDTTLKAVKIKADEDVSGANAVFGIDKNGVELGAAAVTITVGNEIGTTSGLNTALAEGDELILNLVSGAINAPLALTLIVDYGTTTAEIADSTDKRYATDAEKTKLSNLSGTNSGDQSLNSLLPSQTENSGKVLKTDGTNAAWQTESGGGGGASDLDDLTDVVISSPANGEVLKYDGTNWVNDTEASGGSVDLSSFGLTAPPALLADDFTGASIDSGKWAVTQENSGVASISSNRLSLRPAAGGSSGAYMFSQFAFNAKDAILKIKVVQAENTNSGFQPVSQLAISDTNNAAAYFGNSAQIDVDAATGNLRFFVNGGAVGSTVTYNAVTHLYWRIRISTRQNKVYLETSADDVSWATHGSATPTFGLTACYVFLRCLNVGGSGAQPAAFIVDDLELFNPFSGLVWDFKAGAFALVPVAF